MYAYKDRLEAIKLYLTYKSYAAVINELGYPSRGALRHWVEEHKQHGDVKKEITRRSKSTEKQRQDAVAHYLEYGKCYYRTCKMLGYPSRALLTQWVKELAPQSRKFKRNGINLTSEEKKAAAFALITRDTSAQKVANDIGVSRESLYQYREQLLDKGVTINKMKKPIDTAVNKLKCQVEQLQDEVFRLQMQKDILEKAGEVMKKQS